MFEKEAKEYVINEYGLRKDLPDWEIKRDEDLRRDFYGYIAGAKENGVVWHDLRKNPEDLPEERHDVLCFVIHNEHRYYLQGYYNDGSWRCTPLGTYLNDDDVVAWCELPKFTEE